MRWKALKGLNRFQQDQSGCCVRSKLKRGMVKLRETREGGYCNTSVRLRGVGLGMVGGRLRREGKYVCLWLIRVVVC